MADLPQSVYDDIANPAVTSITLPTGTYNIPSQLLRSYPNLTVNGPNTILTATPTQALWGNEFYPFKVASIEETPPVVWDESPGSTDRKVSGLSGTVTADTLQLTMIPGEIIMDLFIGEEVILLLGVDYADPVEPYIYHPARIAAVDTGTGVITFKNPIGKAVPDYVNVAGLQAVTDPSLWWKIGNWGDWPSDANFSKGFGTHHGMQRFFGGVLANNVTFNNINLQLTSNLTVATIPNGIWPFSFIAVRNCYMNNCTINNPIGNCIHRWKAFDCHWNNIRFTGQGISAPGGGMLATAYAFTDWGGDDFTHTDIAIEANDVVLDASEVNTGKLKYNRVNVRGTYTSVRTYPSAPVIMGFVSVLDAPEVRDATIRGVTTGGTAHQYYAFEPITFSGRLRFDEDFLSDYFDFGNLKFPTFLGTVRIRNKDYGYFRQVTETRNIAFAPSTDVALSGLVLPTARFRVTSFGDLRDITDSFGNNYWSAAGGGAWVTLNAAKWHQIPPTAADLTTYEFKLIRFWFTTPGSSLPAVIEMEYNYMPLITQEPTQSGIGAGNVNFVVRRQVEAY